MQPVATTKLSPSFCTGTNTCTNPADLKNAHRRNRKHTYTDTHQEATRGRSHPGLCTRPLIRRCAAHSSRVAAPWPPRASSVEHHDRRRKSEYCRLRMERESTLIVHFSRFEGFCFSVQNFIVSCDFLHPDSNIVVHTVFGSAKSNFRAEKMSPYGFNFSAVLEAEI